jgi:hypothetical protein
MSPKPEDKPTKPDPKSDPKPEKPVAKQFNPNKPKNSRGDFYSRGTPEEEEKKHLERIKGAKERKDKKAENHNAR